MLILNDYEIAAVHGGTKYENLSHCYCWIEDDRYFTVEEVESSDRCKTICNEISTKTIDYTYGWKGPLKEISRALSVTVFFVAVVLGTAFSIVLCCPPIEIKPKYSRRS